MIVNNADHPGYRSLGNLEGSAAWSRLGLIRRFNVLLPERIPDGATVFDLEWLASEYGVRRWSEPRWWYLSKNPFAPEATGVVAHAGASLIAGIRGRQRKCLVLDMDNTLWGGVAADDGFEGIRIGDGPEGEAFEQFQRYLQALKGRGVILCVCSKNNEEIAREVFGKRTEMVLSLDDFAMFVANWNDKAANIRHIAGSLNIGLDAVVFVDDNVGERALVRRELPSVCVPEMPADPSEYRRVIDQALLFETVRVSEEDRIRADSYRQNAGRQLAEAKATDLESFLKDLSMVSEWGLVGDEHVPRVAQLINKSNQFHLTTRRYTESQVKEFTESKKCRCVYFKLRDRFGECGLISVVIVRDVAGEHGAVGEIDTWVMSCRVLCRGMERFVLTAIAQVARSRGWSRLRGRFIATKKNKLVEGLYRDLGFRELEACEGESLWELALDDAIETGDVWITEELRAEADSA